MKVRLFVTAESVRETDGKVVRYVRAEASFPNGLNISLPDGEGGDMVARVALILDLQMDGSVRPPDPFYVEISDRTDPQ